MYTLSDVARLTRANRSTVQSWFRSTRAVFGSDYAPIGGDYAVSFHDLIDVLVAAQFRKAGVSLRLIRRAYVVLSRELGVEHPFCHASLYTDGLRIVLRVGKLKLISLGPTRG